MKAETTNGVVLPTEERYNEVYGRFSIAYDDLENLALDLRQLIVGEGEPDFVSSLPTRPATAADVGLLWSFLDGMRLHLLDINEQLERLQRAMITIDSLRLDGRSTAPNGNGETDRRAA